MVVDAVRSYFNAVSGLTELTRKRAVTAAKTLLKMGDDRIAGTASPPDRTSPAGEDEGDPRTSRVGHDIQSLAAELIETNQANRAALASLVEAEVNRVLERHDLVRRDEYERVVRRVAELERRLATQRGPASRPAAGGVVAAAPQDDTPSPAGEPANEATEPEKATDTADEQPATATEPTAESGGSDQETSDRSDPQEPATQQRSATAGKNTATTGKQSASKTAGKSGKSKSTTKRSGGRARSTTPANSNEQ